MCGHFFFRHPLPLPHPLPKKGRGGSLWYLVSGIRHLASCFWYLAPGILFLLFSLPGFTQCFNGNTAFGPGEEASYEVSFNFGPIWIDGGIVNFKSEMVKFRGKDTWHLLVSGHTYPSYEIFYRVHDYYESWVDPESFRPIEFRRNILEGGYTLLNTMYFDYSRQWVLSNTKRKQDAVVTDTLRPGPCAFDMLTSVYFTRAMDLANLPLYKKIPVKVLIDDSIYNIYIRNMGKEIVESRDGTKYHCIKYAAKMVTGTIFTGGEDVNVWLTDDENKIPIYVEAKIILGSVKAYLKETKGLLNPMSARIKN